MLTCVRVVLAGGSGYVGSALRASLAGDGHQVAVLTRRSPAGPGEASWDGRSPSPELAAAMDGADAIVNLAGANIGSGRWTAGRKREILASRVDSAAALIGAARRLPAERRPRTYVSASGVDYYGDAGPEPVTEQSPPGRSFLAGVCVAWEAAAAQAADAEMRVAILRCGVVFGKGASVLRLMSLPYRLFVGGPVGGGAQYLSWIDLDDAVAMYRWALESGVSGPVNATSPDPQPLAAVGRAIGRVLHRPHWLPTPAFGMRILLGEQADLLLHGRRALPEVAVGRGFQFRRPRLEDTLRESL